MSRELARSLSKAAGSGDDALVRKLIERGADVDSLDSMQQTPLMKAAMQSHQTVVETLLECGASLEPRGRGGRSALHNLVLRHDNVHLVELLCSHGAPHYARDADGRTPLHIAAWWGRTGSIEVLLKFGADPTARDSNQSTPADLAVQFGHSSHQLREAERRVRSSYLRGVPSLQVLCGRMCIRNPQIDYEGERALPVSIKRLIEMKGASW